MWVRVNDGQQVYKASEEFESIVKELGFEDDDRKRRTEMRQAFFDSGLDAWEWLYDEMPGDELLMRDVTDAEAHEALDKFLSLIDDESMKQTILRKLAHHGQAAMLAEARQERARAQAEADDAAFEALISR